VKRTGAEIRKAMESNWKEYLSRYGNLFSSNRIDGSTPPSVFVGAYGYPKVLVGPMLPPIHGDTMILDSPEKWVGKSLEDIVNYRLSLVRGIKPIRIEDVGQEYIENLQVMSMSERSTDAEMEFVKNASPVVSIDGEGPIYGPIGEITSAKFSSSSSDKNIQRSFYDKDLLAQDAVVELYNRGIEISRIQKCFSIGMFGKNRKLVPTRWSITATDDIVSKSLVDKIVEYDIIDRSLVFSYNHLGNFFCVIMFPSRWMFEMQEAWHDEQGKVGFGSDFEDIGGLKHYPETAGAHFASRLAVSEYLTQNKTQAAVMVLREIRPEYAVPVGVWQVREGVRMALKQNPIQVSNFQEGIKIACNGLSIGKNEWLSRSKLYQAKKQKSISDFF
jgi:DNA repair protein NreA